MEPMHKPCSEAVGRLCGAPDVALGIAYSDMGMGGMVIIVPSLPKTVTTWSRKSRFVSNSIEMSFSVRNRGKKRDGAGEKSVNML